MWFIICTIVCMLSVFGLLFELPAKEDVLYRIMFTFGSVCWIISIIIGVVVGFDYFKEKWKNRNIKYDDDGLIIWDEDEPKEKEPSIIIEFVKAKYNKYCPKIDWKSTK